MLVLLTITRVVWGGELLGHSVEHLLSFTIARPDNTSASSVRIYNYWDWEKPHYTIVPDHNDPMPVNAEMGHLKPPGASLVRSMAGREAWLLLGDFSIKLFNVSLWFYCHTKLAKSHDMIRFTIKLSYSIFNI